MSRNRDRLHWMMSRFTGYAGIVSELTPSVTQNLTIRDLIKRESTSRGLSTLSLIRADSSTTKLEPDFTGDKASPVQIILPAQRPEELKSALKALLDRMKADQRIVAFVNPGPLALEALKAWLDHHQNVEFDLIPLSALLRLEGQG